MLALAERGVKSTQATLSRDIKDLRLIKEQGADGKYRYTQSGSRENDASSEKLRRIFKDSLVSYDVAQNLLVVKTLMARLLWLLLITLRKPIGKHSN